MVVSDVGIALIIEAARLLAVLRAAEEQKLDLGFEAQQIMEIVADLRGRHEALAEDVKRLTAMEAE
jgi:hypothetical protein